MKCIYCKKVFVKIFICYLRIIIMIRILENRILNENLLSLCIYLYIQCIYCVYCVYIVCIYIV